MLRVVLPGRVVGGPPGNPFFLVPASLKPWERPPVQTRATVSRAGLVPLLRWSTLAALGFGPAFCLPLGSVFQGSAAWLLLEVPPSGGPTCLLLPVPHQRLLPFLAGLRRLLIGI